MITLRWFTLTIFTFGGLLFFACKEPTKETFKNVDKPIKKSVKVAAIQCYSRMGEKDYNFKLIAELISKAAENGAKIIVLPEAALSGYMNPATDLTWTSEKPDENQLEVKTVAETTDGEFVKKYLELAKKLKIYLTIPFIEVHDKQYFNSVLLASPEGKIILHHRKKSLWNQGDSYWCTKGNLPPAVVKTEYGKIGTMICYDVHSMPEEFKKLESDIVLYSVGWYGPNTDDWFKNRFPNKYVIPNNFSVIAANWSHEENKADWIGCGFSNVVYRNGIVLSITEKTSGSTIVYAELPLQKIAPTSRESEQKK